MADAENKTQETINTENLKEGKTATGKVEEIKAGVREGSIKDRPEVFLAEDRKMQGHPNPNPQPHSSAHRSES